MASAGPDGKATVTVRDAEWADVPAGLEIHNQGIIDRVATLDLEPHTLEQKRAWFERHGPRHPVIVARPTAWWWDGPR